MALKRLVQVSDFVFVSAKHEPEMRKSVRFTLRWGVIDTDPGGKALVMETQGCLASWSMKEKKFFWTMPLTRVGNRLKSMTTVSDDLKELVLLALEKSRALAELQARTEELQKNQELEKKEFVNADTIKLLE
jgi:hypothetical protein